MACKGLHHLHMTSALLYSMNVFPQVVLLFPTYGFDIVAFIYILITQMTKCSLCSKFDDWEYSAEVSVTYNRLNVDWRARRNSVDRSRLHIISLFIVLRVLGLKQDAPVTLEAIESVLLLKVRKHFLRHFLSVSWV